MKYKTAKVISHPRAGSHYLAQLLNINFFNLENYLPLYAGHNKSHEAYLIDPNIAVFYIHRNINDTVESMFNLRDRFGLVCTTLEAFKVNKLSYMHNANINSVAVRNIAGDKQEIIEVDTALSNINLTPGEYIHQHHVEWLNVISSNFILIAYEDLITDFHNTMLYIADFLGSNKIEFIQEHTQVGWYAKHCGQKTYT